MIVGECEVSPEDLATRGGDERSDRNAAEEWLVDELADGEWHESRGVKARARAAGLTEKVLRTARERLGVEDRREGFPAVSEWRLPVVPTVPEAKGTTGKGATGEVRMAEPNRADPRPQSCPTSGKGTTGNDRASKGAVTESEYPILSRHDERLATLEEEAELERVRAKFGDEL